MDKNLIEYFVAEVKEQTFLKKLFKKSVIPFDKYFKYSGKTEPPKLDVKKELHGGIPIYKISRHEDLVIDYYFRNANSTLRAIAEDLEIDVSLVRKILDKHFDNLKLKKNENNNKNGK